MDTKRLRQLAERFSLVGVGGFYTADEQRELVRLALEAAAALEQAAPVSAWEPLADGEYTVNSSVQAGFKGDYLPATVTIRKDQLSIAEGDWGYESIACNLPDNIRLCQRPATAAGEEG